MKAPERANSLRIFLAMSFWPATVAGDPAVPALCTFRVGVREDSGSANNHKIATKRQLGCGPAPHKHTLQRPLKYIAINTDQNNPSPD